MFDSTFPVYRDKTMQLIHSLTTRWKYKCPFNDSVFDFYEIGKNCTVKLYDFPPIERTILIADPHGSFPIVEKIPSHSIITVIDNSYNDPYLVSFMLGTREEYKIHGLKINSYSPFYCGMYYRETIKEYVRDFWNSKFPYHHDYINTAATYTSVNFRKLFKG